MKDVESFKKLLIDSGYNQRTTVLFQKDNVQIKLIDNRGVRISILLADDMELTTFNMWDNIDLSKLTAL